MFFPDLMDFSMGVFLVLMFTMKGDLGVHSANDRAILGANVEPGHGRHECSFRRVGTAEKGENVIEILARARSGILLAIYAFEKTMMTALIGEEVMGHGHGRTVTCSLSRMSLTVCSDKLSPAHGCFQGRGAVKRWMVIALWGSSNLVLRGNEPGVKPCAHTGSR